MKITCCPGCNSNFTSVVVVPQSRGRQTVSKCPLILRCGHTFCEVCMIQSAKKRTDVVQKEQGSLVEVEFKAEISCPICKRLTLLPSGVKDLPRNIYLTACISTNHHAKLEENLGHFVPLPTKKLLQKSMLDSMKDNKSDLKCNMCGIKKASCECKECDNVLCSDCFNIVHKLSAAIKHHKPVAILREGSKERETLCEEHKRPIEYFCTEDNVPICSRCYITGDHKQHPIVSFEEKNKDFVDEIQQELPVANAVLTCLKKVDKQILSTMPAFKSETKALIEKVNASFVNLHALLQAREMEIIDCLTAAYYNGLHELEEKRVKFEHCKLNLEISVKQAKKLTENSGFVMDAENTLEGLRGAKNIPCVLTDEDPVDVKRLQWQENGSSELLSAICSFGNIIGEMNDRVQFKTAEDAQLLQMVPDDDTDSVSSRSSAISNKSVVRSESILSRALSTTTDYTEDDVELEREDTDGGSLKSKTVATKETITEPIVKGPPQKVVLSHINSPNSFYVQLVSNRKKLETLSHNMNVWCSSTSSSKYIPLTLERNMLVLARYSGDKQWYRARVLSIEDPSDDKGTTKFRVRVVYIDFGNEEVVGLKDVRTMQDRFMDFPEFKVHCALFDMAPFDEDSSWDVEVIHEFQKLTNEKVLIMNALARSIDALEVDLTYIPSENVSDDLFVSVRDVLIFLELARFKHHSDQAKIQYSLPSYSKAKFIPATVVKSDSIVEIDITQVKSPWDFHMVVRGEENDYYTSMMDQMQKLYKGDMNQIYRMYYPRCGVMCVAQWKNGTWYRAKVLAAPVKRKVRVQLVDIGEIITVHYEKLRKIHSDYVKLPVQAVPCTLTDVCPLGGADSDWCDEVRQWCQTVMSNSRASARVVRWASPAKIVLWLGQETDPQKDSSINSLLVLAGLAHSTGPASISATLDLGTSLPLPVEDNVLQKPRLSSSCSSSRSTNASPASSPPKKTLVTKASPTHTKELSSQTGSDRSSRQNLGTTSQKKAVKTKKHCKKGNKGLEKKQSATSDSLQDRKEKSSSEALDMNNKDKIQEEIHKAMSLVAGEESLSHKQPMYIQVVMTCFNSPSDFFLRDKEKEEQVQKLMAGIQKACLTGEDCTQAWNLEDCCAVRNPKDETWYRGTLKKLLEPDRAVVELADFGSLIEVTSSKDLQSLAAEFCKTESNAVRCYLGDLIPAGTTDKQRWSSTAIDFMAGQIFEKNLYVKQMDDASEEGVPVDIIVEEVIPETAFEPASRNYHSLRQYILDEGLAMPNKRMSSETGEKVENRFMKRMFGQECDSSNKAEDENKENESSPDVQSSLPSHASVHSDAESEDQVMSLEVPKSVCLPELPEVEVGSEMTVIPTFVGDDGVIYAQPVVWEGQIEHMSQELQRIYEDAVPTFMSWQVGQLCVSQFPEDGLWYRAKIMEFRQEEAKVQYIDFGNTAWVPVDQLMEMCSAFAEEHLHALHCVLFEAEPSAGDGVWPTPVLAHIHEHVVNNECVITVHGSMKAAQETLVFVSLTNEKGFQFPDYLFSELLATNREDITHFYKRSALIGPVLCNNNPYSLLDVGGIGSEFRATVTHVELPNVVYVQRLGTQKSQAVDSISNGKESKISEQIMEFEKMAEELNRCSSMPFVKLPDKGVMCAGQFSVDGCWYRAVCVESYPSTNSCLLVYVDFGTSEVVHLSKIRILPSEFWSIPAQAIRCYFNIVPPPNHAGIFKTSTLMGVVETLSDKELLARVVQTSPLTLELWEEKEDGELSLAYDMLISSGLAQLPAQADDDSLTEAGGRGFMDDGDPDVVYEMEDEEEEKSNTESSMSLKEQNGDSSSNVERSSESTEAITDE
ncbi:RING finger protein 17 [Aplysia californica]|uniref:RING finger protein 17 n=1 Tax=Aplysia californica TaxID=6500 RepID=A0ABM0JUQ5_APLCA|nr:RING finger protein 17 [Aplysia californica]